MARALSGRGLLAALSDGVALVVERRGYSTAASAAATGSGRFSSTAADAERAMMRHAAASGSESSSAAASCSWLSDPATGFYRPASGSGEVDVAELRRMVLKHRS